MIRFFEFDVTLLGAEPPVWRRFQIRAEATFGDLHHAIQDACGWMDYHLFQFQTVDGGVIAGIPDEEGDEPDPDADHTALTSYFPDSEQCIYLYDFGDGWEHNVELRQSVEKSESFQRRLIDGARAFPPEDSGGIFGYRECVAIARGGPDREGLREWLGDWDPEGFDLENVRLAFNT